MVVDSDDIQKKMSEDENERTSEGSGFVKAIERYIEDNLRKMKIDGSQVIFDEIRNVPYKLRPYIRPIEESSGPDTVFIYHKKTGSKEPIEKISPIVKALATKSITTRRIYVDRNRYETLNNFVKEKYPSYI